MSDEQITDEQVVAQAVAPFVETVGDAAEAAAAVLDALRETGFVYRLGDMTEEWWPPDGMVEAAAKAIHDNDRGTRPTKDERWDQLGEIQEFYHLLARAALVAAARWEAPGE